MDARPLTLDELDAHIAAHPADADALCRRAALHWAMGHRGRAMTDYAAAAALDPSGPATAALEHLHAIMDFTAPDLYNP